MKTILSLLFIALLVSAPLTGQTSGNCTVDVILSAYSQRNFTPEPVTDQQLDLILKCGIKAPSARNNQPWKFTVIKDEASMMELINNAAPGNFLIVVSGIESQSGNISDFDCGLATQSMFIAAHSLGLGARIYGSPVRNVTLRREAYQIPAGYKPVMVLRIGNIDKSVDAVSAASTRKMPEEVINYKK